MLKIVSSNRFKKDLKLAIRRGYKVELLEEVVNMLGISDTVLREDSIVYQYSNDNMALSDVDWVTLKLLYSSDIKSGMDAESCKAVIQKLYY